LVESVVCAGKVIIPFALKPTLGVYTASLKVMLTMPLLNVAVLFS
jgi:hypothetical protein